MKFLRSWLEKYIDLQTVSDQALASAITSHSSEVESVIQIGDWFAGKVVVGKIAHTRAHPNADRLKIFDVQIGSAKTVQIVSAASNVRDGIYVPVALEGAVLPGFTISPRIMRGETSFGMCCGKSELLQEEGCSDGLWELDVDDSRMGVSICEVYPKLFPFDTVLDIKILPDRLGAIGSYIGMALEVAKLYEKPDSLKGIARQLYDHDSELPLVMTELPEDSALSIQVKGADTSEICSVFGMIRGILDDEFVLPLEYSRYIYLLGIHSVNPLSDVSNCIMLEAGQPIHVFDTDSLRKGNQSLELEIRELEEETLFYGLGNMKEKKLPLGVRVLVNSDQPHEILTIPSLVGGDSTKVLPTSRDIIIELPDFTPSFAMKQAFLSGYRSEGARLWSSGGHPLRTVVAFAILKHVVPHSQWTNLTFPIEKIHTWYTPRTILVDQERIAEWHSPYTNDVQTVMKGMKAIGFYNEDEHVFGVRAPAYSTIHDLATLYTEACYHTGTTSMTPHNVDTGIIPPYQSKQYYDFLSLKQVLVSLGYDEVITRPFVPSGEIRVLKPQNSELGFLRTSLLPSLLQAASQNYAQGYTQCQLFELNRIYTPSSSGKGVEESIELSLVALGAQANTLVTTIHDIAFVMGIPWNQVQVLESENEEGRTYEYILAPNVILVLHELSNSKKKTYDLPLTLAIWGISLSLPPGAWSPPLHHSYQDLSPHPFLIRDYTREIAPNIRSNVLCAEVQSWMSSHLPDNLTCAVTVLDRFVTSDKSTITLRFVFNHNETVLTPAQIEPLITTCLNHFKV